MTTFSSFSKGSGPAWFRKWVLSPFLVLFLVLGLAGAPEPAYANDYNGDIPIITQLINGIKQGLEQIKWLKDIFEFVNSIFSLLNDFLDRINTSINKIGVVISAGQQAVTETETRLAQEREDNAVKNAMQQGVASSVAKHTPPPASEDALHHCRSIVENKKPMMLEDSVRALAAGIAKGIMLQFRGAGKNGEGAQYDVAENDTRMGKNTNGDAVTVHPVQGTSPAGVEGPTGAADYDIDVARWDSQPLLVPRMTYASHGSSNKVTVTVPVPSGDGLLLQQRWVAARNFCYEIAGRRPSPPYGKQLDTADGKHRMATWNHCAAIQSAFVLACANYVARFSRFNPSDSPSEYEATKELCKTGAKEGYGGSDTSDTSKLPTVFDKCQYGLSQYESEYMTLAICAGPAHATAAAGGGASYPEIMTNNDICALRITTWQTRNAAERANFLAGVAGMLQIDSCWAGAEGQPVQTKSTSLEERREDRGSARKTSLHRESRGERVSLPQTVAQ